MKILSFIIAFFVIISVVLFLDNERVWAGVVGYIAAYLVIMGFFMKLFRKSSKKGIKAHKILLNPN